MLAVVPAHAAEPWQDALNLPVPGALSCGWQQDKSLQVAAPGAAIAGNARIVLYRDSRELDKCLLEVTVRDQQGMTVTTIRHDSSGHIISAGGDGWTAELSRLVLLAVYLWQLDPLQWLASQPDWTINKDRGRMAILYRGKLQARIDYRDPPEPGTSTAFSLSAKGFALLLEGSAATTPPQP